MVGACCISIVLLSQLWHFEMAYWTEYRSSTYMYQLKHKLSATCFITCERTVAAAIISLSVIEKVYIEMCVSAKGTLHMSL